MNVGEVEALLLDVGAALPGSLERAPHGRPTDKVSVIEAKEMEGQQLIEFEAMMYSTDVIASLHAGMESDVKFWKQAQRHTPPADAPVVQELVEAKVKLFESMALFLASHPQNGDP